MARVVPCQPWVQWASLGDGDHHTCRDEVDLPMLGLFKRERERAGKYCIILHKMVLCNLHAAVSKPAMLLFIMLNAKFILLIER